MKRKSTILISLLLMLILGVIFLSQHNILSISHKNKKTEFLGEVDLAMRKALKEFDYKLFDQCVIHSEDMTISEELLRDFESLKMGKDTTSNDYGDLEEIDRYESLMLKFLVESKSKFDFQSLGMHFVDSVVNSCFKQFAINASYELGLYYPLESRFIFQTTGRYEKELLRDGVRFEVFSPKLGDVPSFDQLIVYFPDLDSWIAKQNARLYLSRMIVSAVLIFCIIAILVVLKRQRELANMKSNFINSMTHEIKTPVATISLACQALQDDSIKKDDALVHTYLNVVAEENDRIKQLVEEVLNLVRVGEKKSPNAIEMSVHKTIEDIAKMHELPAKEKGGEIILQFNATNDLIVGDKIHIGNAISNLIDNALKYGRKNPTVTISTENTENSIVINVKDNGIGIRKIDQHKIFDEFYRVDTGNIYDVKGHGLGLNYVKHVAEFHQGSIKVKSELHHGSTFIFTLPLKK